MLSSLLILTVMKCFSCLIIFPTVPVMVVLCDWGSVPHSRILSPSLSLDIVTSKENLRSHIS